MKTEKKYRDKLVQNILEDRRKALLHHYKEKRELLDEHQKEQINTMELRDSLSNIHGRIIGTLNTTRGALDVSKFLLQGTEHMHKMNSAISSITQELKDISDEICSALSSHREKSKIFEPKNNI